MTHGRLLFGVELREAATSLRIALFREQEVRVIAEVPGATSLSQDTSSRLPFEPGCDPAVRAGQRQRAGEVGPALAVFAAARTPWPLGLLLRRPPRNWRALAHNLGVATINCDQRALTRRAVATLKTASLPLVAFTVNDPARARALTRWGVDSLITDDPLALDQGS